MNEEVPRSTDESCEGEIPTTRGYRVND
eukprot:SAG11_NODE_9888_length_872_cov_1.182406_2_plen_27_part_01